MLSGEQACKLQINFLSASRAITAPLFCFRFRFSLLLCSSTTFSVSIKSKLYSFTPASHSLSLIYEFPCSCSFWNDAQQAHELFLHSLWAVLSASTLLHSFHCQKILLFHHCCMPFVPVASFCVKISSWIYPEFMKMLRTEREREITPTHDSEWPTVRLRQRKSKQRGKMKDFLLCIMNSELNFTLLHFDVSWCGIDVTCTCREVSGQHLLNYAFKKS